LLLFIVKAVGGQQRVSHCNKSSLVKLQD